MVGKAGHVAREGEVLTTREASNLDLYAFARGDRAHPQAAARDEERKHEASGRGERHRKRETLPGVMLHVESSIALDAAKFDARAIGKVVAFPGRKTHEQGFPIGLGHLIKRGDVDLVGVGGHAGIEAQVTGVRREEELRIHEARVCRVGAALIDAGLTITALEETPYSAWCPWPELMVADSRGFILRDNPERLPLQFAITATKS